MRNVFCVAGVENDEMFFFEKCFCFSLFIFRTGSRCWKADRFGGSPGEGWHQAQGLGRAAGKCAHLHRVEALQKGRGSQIC